MTGQLIRYSITFEVVLESEQLGTGKDHWGNFKTAFEAKTSIGRHDFGLTWN